MVGLGNMNRLAGVVSQTFIEQLLCARWRTKGFASVRSFHPPNNMDLCLVLPVMILSVRESDLSSARWSLHLYECVKRTYGVGSLEEDGDEAPSLLVNGTLSDVQRCIPGWQEKLRSWNQV